MKFLWKSISIYDWRIRVPRAITKRNDFYSKSVASVIRIEIAQQQQKMLFLLITTIPMGSELWQDYFSICRWWVDSFVNVNDIVYISCWYTSVIYKQNALRCHNFNRFAIILGRTIPFIRITKTDIDWNIPVQT